MIDDEEQGIKQSDRRLAEEKRSQARANNQSSN
jgi:hypothetical protein